MFRRKQLSQLAKNFVAESECVIEFGEDAPDPLGSTAWVRLRCEPCKVVPDRRDVRIEIGDLARRRQRQLVKLGGIRRIDRERRQCQGWKRGCAVGTSSAFSSMDTTSCVSIRCRSAAISPTNADAMLRISRRCMRPCRLQLERDAMFSPRVAARRAQTNLASAAFVRFSRDT